MKTITSCLCNVLYNLIIELKSFRGASGLLRFCCYCCYHYSDVMRMRWRVKSPASRFFTEPSVQAHIKENIKELRHWPFLWNAPATCEFLAQRASKRQMFPFDAVIMCSKLIWSTFRKGNLTQIAKFMGPTWGPPGSCRPQMGPMNLAIRIIVYQPYTMCLEHV